MTFLVQADFALLGVLLIVRYRYGRVAVTPCVFLFGGKGYGAWGGWGGQR